MWGADLEENVRFVLAVGAKFWRILQVQRMPTYPVVKHNVPVAGIIIKYNIYMYRNVILCSVSLSPLIFIMCRVKKPFHSVSSSSTLFYSAQHTET